MANLISIDWLTLYGEYEPTTAEYLPHYLKGTTKKGGQVFSEARPILYHGKQCAVIAYHPMSRILQANAAQMTFSNWVLYDVDFLRYVRDVCLFVGFRPVSISRIDVAVDFNFFACGLAPKDFVNGFFKGKYVKNGGGNFASYGKCGETLEVNTLAFGKRASGVFARLYNKSVEQVEQVSKPWIKEMWRTVGLDETKGVWRLEFELRGRAVKIANMGTGEFGGIAFDCLLSRDYLCDLLSMLYRDYFDFRIFSAQANKSRWKRLNMFNFQMSDLKRVRAFNMSRGGLREKILIKNLHKFSERYGYKDLLNANVGRELADDLAKNTGLQKWYYSKLEDWQAEE